MATGWRAPRGLPGILKHCLDTPGVHLIDCPVDYSENDQILNKDIKALSARAWRRKGDVISGSWILPSDAEA